MDWTFSTICWDESSSLNKVKNMNKNYWNTEWIYELCYPFPYLLIVICFIKIVLKNSLFCAMCNNVWDVQLKKLFYCWMWYLKAINKWNHILWTIDTFESFTVLWQINIFKRNLYKLKVIGLHNTAIKS